MPISMNRQQRRASEKTGDKYLHTPCSIVEATQIARGVAEDVVADFSRQESHLKIAMSLQIEIIKEVLISSGLISEEEFRVRYMQKAEEFQRMQQEAMLQAAEQVDETPSMSMETSEVEVVKE